MAFTIKKSDISNKHKTATKEFTHENGLKVTFKSVDNPAFQKACALISAANRKDETTELTLNAISKDAISDDVLTADEAFGYAIGEHLIAEWDLTQENDDGSVETLEPTGANFAALIGALDEPVTFVMWCMDCAKQVADDVGQAQTDTKKKPLKDGSGKKTTAA